MKSTETDATKLAIAAIRKAANALVYARRALAVQECANKKNAIHRLAMIQVDLTTIINDLR